MITGENTNTILIKRVFARTMDFIIYMLLCSFILYRIIYIGPSNLMNHFLWIMMVSVPMLLIEPLWIHFTKTTPGKWLMGLSVCTENGNKLELRDAYARTGKILVFGFGFFIPIIVLICMAVSFYRIKNALYLPWESGNKTTCLKRGNWSYVLAILGICVGIFISVLLPVTSILPPNRGFHITKEQILENYNYYTKIYHVENTPELDIQMENGRVTKVAFEVETNQAVNFEDKKTLAVCAFMAYISAQANVSYNEMIDKELLNMCGYSLYEESFSFEIFDYTVDAVIEKRGYENKGNEWGILASEVGEEPYYHLIFSMQYHND